MQQIEFLKKIIPLTAAILLGFALLTGCASDEEEEVDYTALYTVFTGFSDKGNGTLTDSSGLTWQKCAIGQVYAASTNDCSGTGGGTTYGAASYIACSVNTSCYNSDTLKINSGPAFDACDTLTFAGYSDWRLPTYLELTAVADGLNRETFLYMFPQTPDDKYFWTLSQYTDTTDGPEAWGVSFAENSFGSARSWDKQESYLYVRCVRP